MLKLRSYSIEKLLELLKDSYLKESINGTEKKSFTNTDGDFVKSSERDEMVAFLMEVCDREDMSLSTETFSLFVILLDRFLSSYKVKSKYLECLAVACLYIACKVREEDENISITSEFLLDCDCKCSISELLRMEQMILTKFEWNVNDVTAADFMHIYYALLVNAYKKTVSVATETVCGNKVWKAVNNSKAKYISDGSIYPPGDLDFLHTLETKLKQCLCVTDLTLTYKPHVLAFSLISLQMERFFENEPSEQLKASLSEMLEFIKQQCKLSFGLVDKCKEQIRIHLTSVENTKTLFDNYFDDYYFKKIRELRQASIFSSPLAYLNNQLAAIKEEDEEEEEEEPEESDEEIDSFDLPEESYDISEYVTKKEDYPTRLAIDDGAEECMMPSYADILAGRNDQKRKLSENSNTDEEIACD